MIKLLKKTGLPLFLLFFVLSYNAAIDVYIGNLGYGNYNTNTAAEVQELSSHIQEQLIAISNKILNFHALYSAEETAKYYDETIIDSKLGALAACIFSNINYVLYGSVYIDMNANLYTAFIKVYDNTKKNILYETNYSKVINNRIKTAYAQDIAMLINNELYLLLTGKPFNTPAPARTQTSAASIPLPSPAPGTADSGINETDIMTAEDSFISEDNSIDEDVRKILGIVEDLTSKLDKEKAEELPEEIEKDTSDDDSLWDAWDAGGFDTETGNSAKHKNTGQQYLSFTAGGGYPFTFTGKWLNPVIPLFTVEETIKLRMYIIDTEPFKLLFRPSTSLNYTYYKEHPDNEYNRYMHLHAIKARLGLDFYLEFESFFAVYLGCGAFYTRNAVDFRTAVYTFYSDTHYALGAYANGGFEILFGNLGIGCDDIFDITFFNTYIMDNKVMLFISVKV